MLAIKFIIVFSLIFISVIGKRNRQDVVIDKVRFKIDKPIRSDLITYLRSLHYIVNFFANDQNDIDLNFEFGIFLSNVHLKSVLQYKGHLLPKSVRDNINLLTQNIDRLISFFNSMVERDNNPADNSNLVLITLFNNEDVWMSQMRKFDTFQFKVPIRHSLGELKKNYSNFETYMNNIRDMTKLKPSPEQSDICVEALASNPVHVNNELTRCEISNDCIEMVYNGTDFGYSLTHRMLFLIGARYGRRCSLISPDTDKKMFEKFCKYAYNEAEYINKNKRQGIAVDLMMEQMIFCLLNGHLEFLRRSWLANILSFQTAEGCFGDKPNARGSINPMRQFKKSKWQLAKQSNHDIMGGRCNGHITSVAAATLATAVRYILETYY